MNTHDTRTAEQIVADAKKAVMQERLNAVDAGMPIAQAMKLGVIQNGNSNARFNTADLTNAAIDAKADELADLSNTELGMRIARLASDRKTNTDEFRALERIRKQRVGIA